MTRAEITKRLAEIEQRREEVLEEVHICLDTLEDNEVMEVLNTYWDSNHYDDHIYTVAEFEDYALGLSAVEILDIAYNAEYTRWSCFFTPDIGSGEQFYDSIAIDDFEDVQRLAEYVLDEDDSLGVDELADLLQEYADLNDEEEELGDEEAEDEDEEAC